MLQSGRAEGAAPLFDDAALFDSTFSTERVHARRGHRVQRHAHTAHELLWGFSGSRTVDTGGATWTLPPGVGLWIPAGVVHAGVVGSNASYYCTFAQPDRVPFEWSAPIPVVVTPLLRELLVHLRSTQDTRAERCEAERLAIELLGSAATATPSLPMPQDERARRVADAIAADPGDRRTIEEWGRRVGAAGRTLQRLFVDDTGMAFGVWRTHARVSAAVQLLLAGHTVADVGCRVGYRNPGAFVKAFRGVTGETPGAYVAARPAVAGGRRAVAPRCEFDVVID